MQKSAILDEVLVQVASLLQQTGVGIVYLSLEDLHLMYAQETLLKYIFYTICFVTNLLNSSLLAYIVEFVWLYDSETMKTMKRWFGLLNNGSCPSLRY